jgi:tryptophan-rich sensory protein
MNGWYAGLVKPPLSPPDWVFGPVWSVLYAMIAASVFLYLWRTRTDPPYRVYLLIAVHLASNFVWTYLFFRLQRPGLALADILLLDVTLIVLVAVFWRASRAASILLWPYLGWVLFATYLNAGFTVLNRAG